MLSMRVFHQKPENVGFFGTSTAALLLLLLLRHTYIISCVCERKAKVVLIMVWDEAHGDKELI
jgi:hypothetical protein